MARPPAQSILARRLLFFFVALLALLAMAPARYTGWLVAVRRVPLILLAPLSRTVHQVSSSVRPPPKDGGALTPAEVEALRERTAEQETAILALKAELEKTRALLVDLGALRALGATEIKHVVATVVGSTSRAGAGTIEIQAGTREGITVDSIAVTTGQQLVGKVKSVGARLSTIVPITTKGTDRIPAVVMLPDGTYAPCVLEARGDGTLRGPLADPEARPGAGSRPIPDVGQVVRLNHVNSKWPRSANMLVVGEVVSVEPSLSGPLRKDVIVRPRVPDLERVPEVIVRVDVEAPRGEEAKR